MKKKTNFEKGIQQISKKESNFMLTFQFCFYPVLLCSSLSLFQPPFLASCRYPKHKGGQHALRVELQERKVELDRRADRRERNLKKFEAKKEEILACKAHSDYVMDMSVEEVKEEKRLSPVHVDDAARSKIAKAVLAMATFEQVAGIPKKKRKKLGKVNKKTWVFV